MDNTNLQPNHTLYVYDVMADDFGDPETAGDAVQVPCLLENTDGWENDNYADATTGNITCQVWPDDPYYIEKQGRLHGLVAQFSRFGTPGERDWYRIASVQPGESLVDGSADLVQLTLARILPPTEVDDEDEES